MRRRVLRRYFRSFLCLCIITVLYIIYAIYQVDQDQAKLHRHVRSSEPRITPLLGDEACEKNASYPTLEEVAERTATRIEGTPHTGLVVTVCDTGYMPLLNLFQHYADSINQQNVMYVALDKLTYTMLTIRQKNVFYECSLQNFAFGESRRFSKAFRLKGAMKFKITLRLLYLGYSVLMTDLDVSLFKDPFPYFNCLYCDIEGQDDTAGRRTKMNVGFLYVRPTRAAISYFEDFVQSLERQDAKGDQRLFDAMLSSAEEIHGLRWRIMDYEHFPNGRQYFYQHYLDTKPFQRAVIYHNNFVNTTLQKIHRAKEFGLWTIDTMGYYSNRDARYIVYNNPIVTSPEQELLALKNAVRLAELLNRTLVLPRFHCPGKNNYQCNWKPEGQCFCTIAEILDLDTFDSCFRDMYREHTFLSNPQVPASIHESSTKAIIILNNDVLENPALHKKGFVSFNPKDPRRGATAMEMLNWLNYFHKWSVIEFHSLYGPYQIFDADESADSLRCDCYKMFHDASLFLTTAREMLPFTIKAFLGLLLFAIVVFFLKLRSLQKQTRYVFSQYNRYKTQRLHDWAHHRDVHVAI